MKPIRCRLGCHVWTGCSCAKCGKVRNSGHDPDQNCLCKICKAECHVLEVHVSEEKSWTSEDPWGVTNIHEEWRCSRCGAKLGESSSQRPF